MTDLVSSSLAIGGYERNCASATFTSNTAVAPGFALANLKNRQLVSSVCRFATGSLSGVEITCTLPANVPLTHLSLIGVNFTVDFARWRVQVASDAGFTSIQYDTNPGGAGTKPLIFNTTTPVISQGFPRYVPPWGRTAPFILPGFTLASQLSERYIRWTIDDSSNPDGYLQAAIAEVGELFQPLYNNFGEEWERGYTPIGVASTGDANFPLHKVIRWHDFELGFLSDAEQTRLRNLFLSYGPNGRLLCIPRPLAPEDWLLDAIWGVLDKPLSIKAHPKLSWLPRFQTKMRVVEVDE